MTTIEDFAFSGCEALKEAVIPGSVTCIEDGAFGECGALTFVTDAPAAIEYAAERGIPVRPLG